MAIPAQAISMIGSVAGELAGQVAETFAEKYGEEVARWLGELAVDHADVLVEFAGEPALDWAQSAASSATGKFAEVTGLTAAGIAGHAGGEAVSQVVAHALAGLPDVDLAPLGAQVRAAAGQGVEQLRLLTNEQIGAFAVYLASAPGRRSRLLSRWRKQLPRVG